MITGNQKEQPWQLKLKKPNNQFNVLVIDDHVKSATVITNLLDYWDINNTHANDCNSCFELLKNKQLRPHSY